MTNATSATKATGVQGLYARVPITSVTIEAVILGVRQVVTFGAPYGPSEAVAALREIDPNAVFHNELRSAGGGYGKKDTKSATCELVTIKKSEKGIFGDFTCLTAEGEYLVVGITRKFEAAAKLAGVLSAERMAQVNGVLEKGGSLPLMLPEAERFTVKYWTGDDGSHFVDDLVK